MTTPEWLKPGIYGGFIGAAAISILGFSWGGWVTGGGAEDMAKTMAQEEVTSALVPVCVELSRVDPDRIAKLATIQDASNYNRYKSVMDAGWATAPGNEAPNRDLAKACIAGLDLEAS